MRMCSPTTTMKSSDYPPSLQLEKNDCHDKYQMNDMVTFLLYVNRVIFTLGNHAIM